MIWGGELVLRDGIAVGQLTSGAWGDALGACVGLAYIRDPAGGVLTPDVARSGTCQVNVGGRLYQAAVHLRPPFDPVRARVQRPLLPRSGTARLIAARTPSFVPGTWREAA